MVPKFSWNKLPQPFYALAPMAGITDQPFRLICKKMGADLLFSEMVSSDAIWHQKKFKIKNLKLKIAFLKTLQLIRFSKTERPFIVQIFGANPEHMAFAAHYIASGEWTEDYRQITNHKLQFTNKLQFPNPNDKNNLKFDICNLEFMSIPDGIDINMGCPAKDVIKTGAGAALIKNPKLAEEIVKAVKKSINIPLSVKTRLGWNDDKNILTFCRMLECAGADAITIHGRTVTQGFSGSVDWKNICEVKKTLKIPVIGNGGIDNKFKIKNLKLKIEPDGYMVGRGARGNPWIFQQAKGLSFHERKAIILEHAQLAYKLRGERGIIEMRKHLAWYFREQPFSSKIRGQLVKVNSLIEIAKVLKSYKPN